MRSPLKPLPPAVARWTVTARILRWLDALVAWLGVWVGAAMALPSASREPLALLAALDVRAHQLHAHPVADVDPLESADDLPFHRRPEHARPRALEGRAGHDRVEPLADP